MEQLFSEKDVIIKDEEKLRSIGYADGLARARRLIETNPENIDLLNVIGLPAYLEGYQAGIEEAKRQSIQQNTEKPKQM